MSEDLKHLKRKSLVSMASLLFQSGYASILGLVANLVLTILLSPAIFGIYITVLSFISVLNYFSDIGLAASLIQKKELKDSDITSTFTVQQMLIITFVTISFILSPHIRDFYKLPQEGLYLYWALLFSFFLSSLKTIPSVFLERKIQFQKIVTVQITENTVFYLSVIIFAFMGLGLQSFTIAVILRAIIGLIMIYIISPWMPRLGISKSSLKELLAFGAPFQASSFLALFKDDLVILYLGKVVGFEGVGYIGWAKKWSEAPLRIVMDSLSRVMFPVIARVQDDKEKITKAINSTLYYQTAIIAPAIVGILAVMTVLVDIIPKYHKWTVALPIFYIFGISSLIVSLFIPFVNFLNALGKVKVTFSFMFLFTCIIWILTIVLTAMFGTYGFPIAHIVVSASYCFVLIKAKKYLKFDFLGSTASFLGATAIMGMVLALLIYFFKSPTYLFVALLIIAGASTYYLSLRFLFRTDLIKIVLSFLAMRKQT